MLVTQEPEQLPLNRRRYEKRTLIPTIGPHHDIAEASTHQVSSTIRTHAPPIEAAKCHKLTAPAECDGIVIVTMNCFHLP